MELMATHSGNKKIRSKSHFLVVFALFSLQLHLQTSVIFVEAASDVSFTSQLRLLLSYLGMGDIWLIKKWFQVHIVYMGGKQHDDPETIIKSHHNMLSTLLGR